MNPVQRHRPDVILGLLLSVALSGCDSEVKPKKASDDLGALRSLVDIEFHASTARWEKFEWPEKLPGELLETNVDSVVLLAETSPIDARFFDALGTGNLASVVPGAARPWLAQTSYLTLKNHGATSMDLSQKSRCRPLEVRLTKTGRPVQGFMCNLKDMALVYLVLESYT